MANTHDKIININSEYGYNLSYQRALAVYNLWLDNGITFRKENIEVINKNSIIVNALSV